MLNTYTSLRPFSIPAWMRAMLLSLLLIGGIQQSKASHIAGSDLTYQSLGNGTYLITYTLYRDCSGITAPTTASVNIGSATCGSATQNVTMTLVPGTGQEITPTCSTTTSSCNGGTSPGIQQYTYTALVSLTPNCPDWHFWVDDCCRNDAITTILNPSSEGLYIDAYLDNTVVDNSSPTFNNVPIVFFCIGQTNYFNMGAVDPDGDSLVYYFIPPRNAVNDPLTYDSSYSINEPISSLPGVTIDANTGDIAVTPTQQEIGLISVMVEEYRNGVLISRVMRDIQVYTVPCSNTLPALSGVNGTTTFNTAACVGGSPLCFNINSSDNNSSDSLWLTWNNGIPGATFTPGTGNRPIGQFCWTPTPADARPNPYNFTVTVHDNSCPSPGSQTYSFQVYVSALSVTLNASTSVQCFGDQTGTASIAAAGIAPFTYEWSSNSTTLAVTPSISNLGAGSYSVLVTDASGCAGGQNFTITQPPALILAMSGTNAQCTGGPGTATANVLGGTPGFTYSWNTVPVQTTAAATNLIPGNYSVTVVDANGCDISGSVTVSGSTPVLATLTTVPSSCGASNGSITVNVSTGSAPYTYTWTPNVSTSNVATGLTSGIYSVLIEDSAGCSTTVSDTISSASLQTAVSGVAPESCPGSNDGAATVTGVGGTGSFTYMWMPGMYNSSTVSNLHAGTYDVQVTDAAGCSSYATVNIALANTVPTVTLPNFTAVCGSTPVQLSGGYPSGGVYSGTGVSNGSFDPTGLSGNYTITYTVTVPGGCSASATSTISVGSSSTVTINASTITCNSIYQPVTLTAVASSSSVTYQWYFNNVAIPGATGSTYDATQNGVYSVEVSDSSGCSSGPSTASYTLNAVDVRCGHNMQKVVLCHVPPGNPGNPQTLCIAPSAVPAHLDNHPGDCLGPCPSPRLDGTASEHTALSAYPNPFTGILNVTFDLDADQNVRLDLYDLEGRLVQPLLEDAYLGGYHISEDFNLTGLSDGIYVLRYESNNLIEYKKITKSH